MTIEEILKLGEMGYTKADIEKLAAAESMPKPKQEPKTEPKLEPKTEPKMEPKTEPKLEPKTEPKMEPKTEPKTEDDYYSKISKQMETILNVIQKSNISNDNQPKPVTAEDALAAIINPPEVKK